MEFFELGELASRQREAGRFYLEFLSQGSLSAGLYVLPAAGQDGQKPHTEDELYLVVSGRATLRLGEEDRPVQSGSLIFVAAGANHYFHSIVEEISLLVIFAPAEYTNRKAESLE